MQQFSFNPAGILSLKDTLKIYKGKNKIRKIRKTSGLSLNPLFKKECHLLSDKFESMEICLRVNDFFIPSRIFFLMNTFTLCHEHIL